MEEGCDHYSHGHVVDDHQIKKCHHGVGYLQIPKTRVMLNAFVNSRKINWVSLGTLLLQKALSSENGAWETGGAIIARTFQNGGKPWLHHVAHFPLEWTSNKFLPRCPSLRVIQLENYNCAICHGQSLIKILYGLKTPHIVWCFCEDCHFFLRSFVAGITILIPWAASLKEVGIIIPRNRTA